MGQVEAQLDAGAGRHAEAVGELVQPGAQPVLDAHLTHQGDGLASVATRSESISARLRPRRG